MAIKAKTTFSLVDQFFNADSVTTLAKALTNACDGFDQKKFINESIDAFPELELKDRIRHMVDRLGTQLPEG